MPGHVKQRSGADGERPLARFEVRVLGQDSEWNKLRYKQRTSLRFKPR